MTVGLVIFDCDGVLVDTEPVIVKARVNILRAIGLEVVEADLAGMSGYSSADASKEIGVRFGREMPADIRDRFRVEFARLMADGVKPIAGVRDLLDALVKPCCVASNGSHAFMRMTLGAAKLIDRFDGRIFSADEVERPKPHPDLFLMAAARMGVAVEHCLVVEDSLLGVTAARAAGMRTIGFVGGEHCEAGQGEKLLALGAQGVARTMAELGLRLGSL